MHDGIRKHTRASSNQRIDRDTQEALDVVGYSRERIQARLAELDREWDIDRALMLNFAIIGAFTASMTMRNIFRHGKLGVFGAMLFSQLSFLAHHAIRRWCPPMPLFRRLGFRSAREINSERTALELRLVTG
jgi:hypothetical protein